MYTMTHYHFRFVNGLQKFASFLRKLTECLPFSIAP